MSLFHNKSRKKSSMILIEILIRLCVYHEFLSDFVRELPCSLTILRFGITCSTLHVQTLSIRLIKSNQKKKIVEHHTRYSNKQIPVHVEFSDWYIFYFYTTKKSISSPGPHIPNYGIMIKMGSNAGKKLIWCVIILLLNNTYLKGQYIINLNG